MRERDRERERGREIIVYLKEVIAISMTPPFPPKKMDSIFGIVTVNVSTRKVARCEVFTRISLECHSATILFFFIISFCLTVTVIRRIFVAIFFFVNILRE